MNFVIVFPLGTIPVMQFDNTHTILLQKCNLCDNNEYPTEAECSIIQCEIKKENLIHEMSTKAEAAHQ